MLRPRSLPFWFARTFALLLLAGDPLVATSAGGPDAFKKMDAGVQLQERSSPRRLGTLSGRFHSSEAGSRLPATVTLRVLEPFLPYPGRQPRRRLFRCPLTDRGAWSCLLPAATYDLAVGAEGFVPQRRKAVRVHPGRDLELGDFELEPSQAITGWLALDGGAIDPASVLLRVVPTGEIDDPKGPVYQGDPLLIERSVRSDGSFRIANVRPGLWSVEARSAGYVTAIGTPVRVSARKGGVFGQTLVLHRPFDLEVVLEPPVDSEGRPWRLTGGPIRTFARGRETRVPLALEAAGEGKGLFRLPRQGPGRYWFAVNDPEDNVFVSRSDVEIHDASESRLVLRVPVLEVEGRVTLGTKPVRGTLYWNDPEETISFRAETDDDGRFQARMSRPGPYHFQIYAEAGGFARVGLEVLEDRPGHATLDIRLPPTRVFGRVEDEDGHALPFAGVTLETAGLSDDVVTEEDGTFQAEGMPEGKLELRASLGTGSGRPTRMSRMLAVEVRGDRPVGPVVLRLLPASELRGKVLDERGREPESRISLDAVLEDGTPVSAQTEQDGSFAIGIPVSSDGATLLLKPDRGALRAVDLRLGQAPPTYLLEAEPGAVRVDLGDSWGRIQAGGRTLEIEQDGVVIPLRLLQAWTGRLRGGENRESARSLSFAALAPGRYRICLGPEATFGRIDAASRRKGGTDCDSGELTPGGELVLSLP